MQLLTLSSFEEIGEFKKKSKREIEKDEKGGKKSQTMELREDENQTLP